MHLGVGDQSPRLDHTGDVDSVAFSHDDKQVVSDHTVRVWGEGVIGPLEGDTDEVNSVAFSHDGKRIVSSSDDSTIRMDSEQQIGSLGYHVRISRMHGLSRVTWNPIAEFDLQNQNEGTI